MNICYIGHSAMPPSAYIGSCKRAPVGFQLRRDEPADRGDCHERRCRANRILRGRAIDRVKITPPYTYTWTGPAFTEGYHYLQVNAVGTNGYSLMSQQRPSCAGEQDHQLSFQ